jgi:hypothetical protein
MVFKQTAAAGSSRKNFRRYMNHLFIYTGTMHFTREPRVAPGKIRAGDFFVQPARGRAYGHAVLVTDLARNDKGTTLALLGQGFMPAQDFHILRTGRSTWFKLDSAAAGVKTPFWDLFKWNSLPGRVRRVRLTLDRFAYKYKCLYIQAEARIPGWCNP